jgi:hypothetical protein
MDVSRIVKALETKIAALQSAVTEVAALNGGGPVSDGLAPVMVDVPVRRRRKGISAAARRKMSLAAKARWAAKKAKQPRAKSL